MGRHISTNRAARGLRTGFYWIKVYNLLPEGDPLRQEVRQRSEFESDNDTMMGDFLTGESKYTFSNGNTATADNKELFMGTLEGMDGFDGVLDTQDPGMKKYHKDGQALLDKINKKYAGQPGHETLTAFTSLIGNYYDSISQGTGIYHAPGAVLYGGAGKLTDVTYGLNSDARNKGVNVFDWNYRSSVEYEAASHFFGIDKIYKGMAEGVHLSTEWEKAWEGGEPDPNKLRELEAKFNKNAEDFRKNVDKFAEKCREDMKLPAEKQKTRKLFKDEDIEQGEIIDGPRAINGSVMHTHQTMMKTLIANGILGAEMIQLKKQVPNDPAHQELHEAMDDLASFALTCQNDTKKLFKSEDLSIREVDGILLERCRSLPASWVTLPPRRSLKRSTRSSRDLSTSTLSASLRTERHWRSRLRLPRHLPSVSLQSARCSRRLLRNSPRPPRAWQTDSARLSASLTETMAEGLPSARICPAPTRRCQPL